MGCCASYCSSSNRNKINPQPRKLPDVRLNTANGTKPFDKGRHEELEKKEADRDLRLDGGKGSGNTLDMDSQQYLVGTMISVEWMLEQMCTSYKTVGETDPTWIIERLNQYTEKDIDHTLVLRVTFGWDHPTLPRSVVVKICQSMEDILPTQMFRKECVVYEWLQTVKKARIPRIITIRKTTTSDGQEPVILMEDLVERSRPLDLADDTNVDLVRDLLKNLAQVHASSWKRRDEWTGTIAENPPNFYRELSEIVGASVESWATMGQNYSEKLMELCSPDNLARLVEKACETLGLVKVLVHGNPVSRNFFASHDGKTVTSILDWTRGFRLHEAHPGCFGEDLAKAVCWNLSPKDRLNNTKRLLEHYHFHFVKSSGGLAAGLLLERIEAAFKWFTPLAAICYLMFLPDDLQRADPKQLERAQALMDECLRQEAAPAIEETEERTITLVGTHDNLGNGGATESTTSTTATLDVPGKKQINNVSQTHTVDIRPSSSPRTISRKSAGKLERMDDINLDKD